ncbi:pyrimidine/purine nucleoside phosphorylase [Vibrio mangrovi]|uniref:Pyrimidine/purine nucleoside phosphorylase n=1 Tax=Vibrio mangrovi TaxID=474394 RepID=A0A1Y6ITS0_9VIBR|nr:pyrimidine/purine nucleoside phosphorylase [Vibrio mangrovi]MDW6004743.1 pyrimidine/purine nucleoside phosphorylase [Vibrio mangrovi]SMS01034.1 hypothetical protein VIM7927_02311 [Vibrio mangrovi]
MIQVNTYFDGNVKSLGFEQQGEANSVGVMAPGEYTFSTAAPEKMTVIKGELVIKRAEDQEWLSFKSGESFSVNGNASFDVQVKVATAYLCEYL